MKNKNEKIILFLFIFFINHAGFSQEYSSNSKGTFEMRLVAGMGKSTFTDTGPTSFESLTRISIGGEIEIRLSEEILPFVLGLAFSRNGTTARSGESRLSIYNVEISLSPYFYLLDKANLKGYFFPAIYGSFQIDHKGIGKFKGFFSSGGNTLSKWNTGISAGLGFKILNKFKVGWKYNFGLNNILGQRQLTHFGSVYFFRNKIRDWEIQIGYSF